MNFIFWLGIGMFIGATIDFCKTGAGGNLLVMVFFAVMTWFAHWAEKRADCSGDFWGGPQE